MDADLDTLASALYVTIVDHHGEPLGSVEAIYLDKATDQPEWALLEAGATGPSRTYVPLVGAGEEGDTVRVPFAKTLIEGAPRMPAPCRRPMPPAET